MVPVHDDANPPDNPSDTAALAAYAAALIEAVERAVPGWVDRIVRARWTAWSGQPLPASVAGATTAAGEAVRAEVVASLRRVLAMDVEAQTTNPLSIIRSSVVHPTAVLRQAGVPAVVRDRDAERLFPDDVYDLSPASFSEVDPTLHEPGLAWGAAKAHVVLARRRR